MKSIKFFAVASAVALLSTTGFTSCNQKNGPDGPEVYNGETVKTQFSISIPEAGKPNAAGAPDVLRMPAANTQDADNFLGMENIVLMPFNTAVSGTPKTAAPVTKDDIRLGSSIGLSDIPSGDNTLQGTAHYKVYKNISIPISTNRFLFYAKGKTTATPNDDQKFQEGLLNVANLTNTKPGNPTTGFTFSPVQIYASGDVEGGNLCTYLTTIANVSGWAAHTEPAVKQLHDDFITMRAGSATSVLAALEDLRNSLELLNETYKTLHSNSTDAVIDDVIAAIDTKVTVSGSTAGSKTLGWGASASFSTYPANLLLPDGAAAIIWSTDKFVVSTSYDWVAANAAANLDVAEVTKYAYPVCIYYFANSGLKTSTVTPLSDPANTTALASMAWIGTGGVLATYYNYTDNYYVATNTRSVAIADPIQYAVARLKTSVKAEAATIKDAKLNDVDVTNLVVNAVLVGGQGAVGFDFTTTSDGDQIIYDKALNPLTAPATYALKDDGNYTPENPTLLLETKESTDILMAVEFINNGPDFYGKDGLIPTNTKFYVVAQLEADDADVTGDKVFKQDYTTTVKLNLKNLSKAYNVIPDLRTSTLELGFSVDLSWKAGYTYEIPIQ
ncbi:MAG: hypothetical protein IKO66_05160 [Paludibacteraceae bacterium]|nr:hypothetical protein [Paludibacteraceae bacterium]